MIRDFGAKFGFSAKSISHRADPVLLVKYGLLVIFDTLSINDIDIRNICIFGNYHRLTMASCLGCLNLHSKRFSWSIPS